MQTALASEWQANKPGHRSTGHEFARLGRFSRGGCVAAGTTAAGAFVESASGVEAGGRTGMTALVTAGCFLLTLFVAPAVAAVPAQAYGPVLLLFGLLMLTPIIRLPFGDLTESIPSFAVLGLMSFTYNIGGGITAGLALYPLCKLAAGRRREIGGGLWALGLLSLLFFVFYPYR